MSASLVEVLMSLGELQLDHDYDPDLLDATYGHTLRLWEGEELIWGGPLTRKPRRSKEGLTFAARSLEFWLGVDDDGPVVEDREFIAGTNKLSNGGFELLGNNWRASDRWRTSDGPEESEWSLVDSDFSAIDARTGRFCIKVVNDPLDDDQLVSDESFVAESGMVFNGSLYAKRAGGTTGKLRVRLVYEGDFRYPNILPNPTFDSGWNNASEFTGDTSLSGNVLIMGPTTRKPVDLDLSDWTNDSEFAGDSVVSGSHLFMGPTTRKQLVVNPSFEDGLTGWTAPAGDPVPVSSATLPRTGTYSAGIGGDFDAGTWLTSDAMTVEPSTRYAWEGFSRITGPIGSQDAGTIFYMYEGTPASPGAIVESFNTVEGTHLQAGWVQLRQEFNMKADIVQVHMEIDFFALAGPSAAHYWDDVTLTRLEGNTCARFSPEFDVTPEESYRGQLTVESSVEATEGELTLTATYSGAALPDIVDDVARIEVTKGLEKVLPFELRPQTGYDTCSLRLTGADVYGQTFDVSAPVLVRLTGNSAHMASAVFDVTPERSYDLRCFVECDAGMTNGDLRVVATFGADDRDNVVSDITSLGFAAGETKLLTGTIKPPSGYDICYVQFTGEDVEGGSFRITNAVVRDAGSSTQVFDTKTAEDVGSYTRYEIETTAPVGSERVHYEVIAEDKANGWIVDDCSLNRVAPIDTAADVLDYICRDPLTGAYLVTPLSIEDHPLPYDLRYRNQTCRSILKQFSRAVMQPPCEWKVSPENQLTWGESVFETRDLILKPGDVELLENPSTEESAEDSLQIVKVVGADRYPVGKIVTPITAEATNDPEGKVDYFGNPWNRQRIVVDSTVDSLAYAQVSADYAASLNATPRQNCRLRLADWKSLGKFNTGDYIWIYAPDADLEDPSNPKVIDGETVYPRLVRVLERSWKLGNGFRAELRAPDGTLTPLEPNWETETTAEIVVGSTFAPEFVSDPQAGGAGNQLARFIASRPR